MADPYESLPETADMSTHMIAGSFAGVMEHCLMYPVDSVKTRMQSVRATSFSITEVLMTMMKEEGVLRPVRGMSAVIGGAGPAHAMYFACYEKMKVVFGEGFLQNQQHVAQAMAGCCATLFHDAVMTPAEAVKQRMQMCASPYKTCRNCIGAVYRKEGIKAFYRSYGTQLSMNVPFQMFHVTTYEIMQDITNKQRDYDPKAHMISGGVAGGVASAMTTPLDVCKTLLNTQETTLVQSDKNHKGPVRGVLNAAKIIYNIRGPWGFFQGLKPRVIFQIPGTAISWSVYEFFKHLISTGHIEHDTNGLNGKCTKCSHKRIAPTTHAVSQTSLGINSASSAMSASVTSGASGSGGINGLSVELLMKDHFASSSNKRPVVSVAAVGPPTS